LEVLSVAQLYRDRAENGFDEIKNQWGWGHGAEVRLTKVFALTQ